MRVDQLERVFCALNRANIRYLVVGGVAVIAHGVMRYTGDLDLVLAFDEANLVRGLHALQNIGFKPRIPLTPEDFAKAENREAWQRGKGMVVFQMALFERDDLPIDIFIQPPFDFDAEYARALFQEIAPAVMAPFVHIDQLIEMKKKVGRPNDLDDVAKLSRLRRI